MSKYDANIIVIGAGSGGLVSAYIAAAIKAKVILIEKKAMGGDCLNTGCVPSKALIRSAKAAYQARNAAQYGIDVVDVQVDFEKVMQRVHEVIKSVEPHDSVERYTSLGVECIIGEAEILSEHQVAVNGKTLGAKKIIIATGASPAVPPIPGIERAQVLTSDTLWQLKSLPKKLLVLGGGPIGCELAQAFSRLGSKVTLVDRGKKVLPRIDKDLSQVIEKQFVEEGVELVLEAEMSRFENNSAIINKNNSEQKIEFDQVLIAVGRQAHTKGFGLEKLGVALNDNGTIKVNSKMQSSVPSIYACGDVAGPYQFTHMAAHQAWYASVNALFSGIKTFNVDYSVVPWVIFTDPELAHVGQSEHELRKNNIDFDVVTYDISDLDRALADGEAKGLVKVLTKKGSDKILGASIVSAHAGEFIVEFIAAMKNKKGLNSILGTTHPYPTWSESNKYSAGVWKKANAPEGLLKWVERFHAFRRG